MGDAEIEPTPAMPDPGTLEDDALDTDQRPHALARDPVCGMDVDPGQPPASIEYRAVPYYFCSQNCKDQFAANPSLYVG